jgi:hypothetical protein
MLGYLDCKRNYNNQSCKARHSWNQVKKPAKIKPIILPGQIPRKSRQPKLRYYYGHILCCWWCSQKRVAATFAARL